MRTELTIKFLLFCSNTKEVDEKETRFLGMKVGSKPNGSDNHAIYIFFSLRSSLGLFRSSVLYVSSAPLSFSPIFPLRFCFFFAFYLFFLFIFVFLSITLALSCPPPHFSSLLSFIPPFSYSSLLLLLSLGTCLDKLFTFQNIISCVVFYIDRCRNSLKLNPISKFA